MQQAIFSLVGQIASLNNDKFLLAFWPQYRLHKILDCANYKELRTWLLQVHLGNTNLWRKLRRSSINFCYLD